MDPLTYYVTTLTSAFKQLYPIILFLVGGYFIFFKLPFLFLKKNMQLEKDRLLNEKRPSAISNKTINQIKDESREGPKNAEPFQHKKKTHTDFKEKPKEAKKNHVRTQTPEEIFNYGPHEHITQSELKKRYFELLKQNHPDRVASMGNDFKKLAEKNTKQINEAYEKLKGKAV